MKFFKKLIEKILPSFCLTPNCDRITNGHPLCDVCVQKIPYTSVGTSCTICGLQNCKDTHKQWNYSFESKRHGVDIDNNMQTLLRSFKYHHRPSWGIWLLEQLYQGKTIDESFFKKYRAVVPVPPNGVATRERGFSSAALIAQYLSSKYGLMYIPQILYRVRGGTQVKRGRRARITAADGRYQVKNQIKVPESILLVDDVWTTGSTAEECAALLKRIGCKNMGVFTLFYAKRTSPEDQLSEEWEAAASLGF